MHAALGSIPSSTKKIKIKKKNNNLKNFRETQAWIKN
jgi:hypothetical protein